MSSDQSHTGEREVLAEVARRATLPDGFQWGSDALESFNFGKERAALAILAHPTEPAAKPEGGEGARMLKEIAEYPSHPRRGHGALQRLVTNRFPSTILKEEQNNPCTSVFIAALITEAVSTLTPAQPSAWRPIAEAAPKVGDWIVAWCVHENAQWSTDPVAEGWEAPVLAQWTDYNGGGWTWHGLAGRFTHFVPAAPKDTDAEGAMA